MAYFVAGQFKSIKNIWENLLSTKEFINPLRFWKVIDIDYLIDNVFKKQDPLVADRIYKSSINFVIPYTCVETGKIGYFSNKKNEDVFEALRATKAMPIVYGKTVKIDDSLFCDSYLSAHNPLNIEKAKKLGASKILVLDSHFGKSMLAEDGYDLWLESKSKVFKDNYFAELNRLKNTDIDPGIFYLRPKSQLEITSLNNDSKLLRATVDLGYEDTINNKGLEVFLES